MKAETTRRPLLAALQAEREAHLQAKAVAASARAELSDNELIETVREKFHLP